MTTQTISPAITYGNKGNARRAASRAGVPLDRIEFVQTDGRWTWVLLDGGAAGELTHTEASAIADGAMGAVSDVIFPDRKRVTWDDLAQLRAKVDAAETDDARAAAQGELEAALIIKRQQEMDVVNELANKRLTVRAERHPGAKLKTPKGKGGSTHEREVKKAARAAAKAAKKAGKIAPKGPSNAARQIAAAAPAAPEAPAGGRGLARLRASKGAETIRQEVLADQQTALNAEKPAPAEKPAKGKKAAAVKAAKPAKAAKAAKAAKPAKGYPEGAKIKLLVANPKRPGSRAHGTFECYKNGQTVPEFVAACAKAGFTAGEARSNLAWDLDHKFLTLS